MFQPDDPDTKFDLAIVGIGFMPLGLPILLRDKYGQFDVKILFPFPPGPPSYQRTWDFIFKMNTHTPVDSKHIHRVDPKGIFDFFDKICSITNYGEKVALFAPYGPKTMSLAMCIYA